MCQFLEIMNQAAVNTMQGVCVKIGPGFSGINAHQSSSGLCLLGVEAASMAAGEVTRHRRGRSVCVCVCVCVCYKAQKRKGCVCVCVTLSRSAPKTGGL